MKLNNIKCTSYSAGKRFSAVLHETDTATIQNITPSQLTIQADDGSIVEKFVDYGRLFSVKHIISENVFEVEFSKESNTDKKISEMKSSLEGISKKINTSSNISSIVFAALAQNEILDDRTISEHSDIFPKWDDNWTGKRGSIVLYNGILYRSVHDIGKGQNVKPSDNPSVWSPVSKPGDEFPDWSQPLGVHDAYNTNDKVTHNNKKWISIVNNNIWEPGIYGWNEYKEA